MHGMTLEQLRAVAHADGVADVTLKARSGAFLVEITTRAGSVAFLSKARSATPRAFGNMASALKVLREVGITAGRFDAASWDPAAKPVSPGARGRAEALRAAHRSAAYNAWLAEEIEVAVADSVPSVPHDEVMARLAARVGARRAPSKD